MMFTRILTAVVTVATLTTAVPALAQSGPADARFAQAQARFDRELAIYRQEFDRYRSTAGRGGAGYDPAYSTGPYRQAPDPRYQDGQSGGPDDGYYDPSRDYRAGNTYRERVLTSDERVYAGEDGRYYCKRSDGTTGLIVGAAGGGILGNVIDGGRSRTVGTLLGAAVGGLAGRAVDQNNSQVRCR